MRKAMIVESPLVCPWRFEENGKYGCGNFKLSDYFHARKNPCPCNEEFPEDCPLDSVIPD